MAQERNVIKIEGGSVPANSSKSILLTGEDIVAGVVFKRPGSDTQYRIVTAENMNPWISALPNIVLLSALFVFLVYTSAYFKASRKPASDIFGLWGVYSIHRIVQVIFSWTVFWLPVVACGVVALLIGFSYTSRVQFIAAIGYAKIDSVSEGAASKTLENLLTFAIAASAVFASLSGLCYSRLQSPLPHPDSKSKEPMSRSGDRFFQSALMFIFAAVLVYTYRFVNDPSTFGIQTSYYQEIALDIVPWALAASVIPFNFALLLAALTVVSVSRTVLRGNLDFSDFDSSKFGRGTNLRLRSLLYLLIFVAVAILLG